MPFRCTRRKGCINKRTPSALRIAFLRRRSKRCLNVDHFSWPLPLFCLLSELIKLISLTGRKSPLHLTAVFPHPLSEVELWLYYNRWSQTKHLIESIFALRDQEYLCARNERPAIHLVLAQSWGDVFGYNSVLTVHSKRFFYQYFPDIFRSLDGI